MSKVKITGHASGTGVLTLTSPNTSTDRTITLPDGTGSLTYTPSIVDGGNATAITINASENVGIGDTTPSARVDIKEDGTLPGLRIQHGGSNTYATILGPANRDLRFELADNGNTDKFDFRNTAGTSLLEIRRDGRGLSQFTAKAWMRFDQYSSNTLRDSHNVSSVTDHGTGEFTMNFSNNMGNTYYCVQASGHYGGGTNDMGVIQWQTNTAFAVGSARFHMMATINSGTTASLYDAEEAMILIFGD